MSDNSNFRPIHNPYIVGNPIKDQRMFFGREDDFAYIRQKIQAGKRGGLLVLCGTRRSGKTSILFQIMNGRLGGEFFPVLIDMQAMAVENDLDFLVKLAEGIIDAVGEPEISIEEDFLARRAEGSLAAFQRLIVKVDERLMGKTLVLLFDEYEIFESHIEKKLISTEVLSLFANWIEHREGVFIVFTGSDRLEERTADYWNRFLGKALHRRISFLSKADSLRLIKEPVRDVVRYEEGLPENIYELTAGHPFYTQVFCQALVDHLNEVGSYDLTEQDLQDVIAQIIENPLPQMIFSWNSLGNLEKLTLSIIGELNKDSVTPVRTSDILAFAKEEGIGFRIEANALNEVLEKLFHRDMLNKGLDDDVYTFKMGLWQRWMARMHSIWQVIDEIKRDGGELGPEIKPGPRRLTLARVVGVVVGIALSAGAAFVYTRIDGPSEDADLPPPVEFTRLTVYTTPPNADVFLGRQRIGKSPIVDEKVTSGDTDLRVELAGYVDVVHTLELRTDEPFETTIRLVPRTGVLKVTSIPSGARVYLDGERTDFLTPAVLEDIPVTRPHDVRLTLAGYITAEIGGVRFDEDSLRVVHHDFSRSTAKVRVVSQPAGADIYVDDRLLGQTPNVYSLTHGTHRIRLQKQSYAESEQDISVPLPGGEIRVVLIKLPPGTLVVKVLPYADIYVNGEMKKSGGSHYEDGTLEPGQYTVVLRHPRYEPVTKIVRITSGNVTELNYDLGRPGAQQ
jgi:hypothetical protein